MGVNTDDDSKKSSSVIVLGGTHLVPIMPIGEDLKEYRVTSTQYSLQSASSYEVIDASTQVSGNNLQSTDDSTTTTTTTSEDRGSGDVERFSKEWKAVVFRNSKTAQSDSFVSKKKVASNQSPQDMIEILKKSVKEGNIKAQESVKDFFHPTPEDLQRIRKKSQNFRKVKLYKKCWIDVDIVVYC